MPEVSLGATPQKDWLIYGSPCLSSGHKGRCMLAVHVVPETKAVSLFCWMIESGCGWDVLPLSFHIHIVAFLCQGWESGSKRNHCYMMTSILTFFFSSFKSSLSRASFRNQENGQRHLYYLSRRCGQWMVLVLECLGGHSTISMTLHCHLLLHPMYRKVQACSQNHNHFHQVALKINIIFVKLFF